MANQRIAYGLCKKYGIKLKEGATPADAWKALKEAGHGDEVEKETSSGSSEENKYVNNSRDKLYSQLTSAYQEDAIDNAEGNTREEFINSAIEKYRDKIKSLGLSTEVGFKKHGDDTHVADIAGKIFDNEHMSNKTEDEEYKVGDEVEVDGKEYTITRIDEDGRFYALGKNGTYGSGNLKDKTGFGGNPISIKKINHLYFGGIDEETLRKSKDFKIKEYLKELDEYRKINDPRKELYERKGRDIQNDINARLKQIKSVPNDIYIQQSDSNPKKLAEKMNVEEEQKSEKKYGNNQWNEDDTPGATRYRKTTEDNSNITILKLKENGKYRAFIDGSSIGNGEFESFEEAEDAVNKEKQKHSTQQSASNPKKLSEKMNVKEEPKKSVKGHEDKIVNDINNIDSYQSLQRYLTNLPYDANYSEKIYRAMINKSNELRKK